MKWLTEWGSSSNIPLSCSPAQREQKWAGTGMETEHPWKKISRWSKLIQGNILGVQRTARGEWGTVRCSAKLLLVLSLFPVKSWSTQHDLLLSNFPTMLFILLAYAAFHKENNFKLLYMETQQSYFQKKYSASSQLCSCQYLTWARRGRKRDFFLFPGVQKKHNKSYIFLFHDRFCCWCFYLHHYDDYLIIAYLLHPVINIYIYKIWWFIINPITL